MICLEKRLKTQMANVDNDLMKVLRLLIEGTPIEVVGNYLESLYEEVKSGPTPDRRIEIRAELEAIHDFMKREYPDNEENN
jgi:hypothetical protein